MNKQITGTEISKLRCLVCIHIITAFRRQRQGQRQWITVNLRLGWSRNEYQAILCYIVRLCLKKQNRPPKQQNANISQAEPKPSVCEAIRLIPKCREHSKWQLLCSVYFQANSLALCGRETLREA